MNVTLIRIDAQDASGAAVSVRLASHDMPEACHLGGEQWEPALSALPDFALDFFGGAFSGQITAPRTTFAVATTGLAAFGQMAATRARFADARVRIWVGDITSVATVDLGPLTLRFDGRLTGEPQIDDSTRTAQFDAAVQDSWADKPLLALFAGTDGIEGPADLTGQVKPLVLGNARFAGGVLIDRVDNVWMVSNGPVQAVNVAYDRLASLGASAGNFASLAALKAASIPNGSWGTCLAQGLVRFGAPPDGRVSFDVSGSNSGTGGYVRRAGAMIRRLTDLAGGTVNAASLTALDTARPFNLQLQLGEQTTARQVIAAIADSVGAVAGVSLRGELFAQALAIGSPSDTLAPDDSSALRVASAEELPKAAPNWRLSTEAQLTFEVHSADEAAFAYRWQGEYSATRVYRRDDVVSSADGASWAFIGSSPAAGQALPVWPITTNANWENFTPPVDPEAIGIEPGATRNTGAVNADGLNAIDAGGPLLIGELPTDKADPGLRNSLLPLGNANRVPFSRFEGGRGWAVFREGSTGGAAFGAVISGRNFILADPVFSASGQNHYLLNDPPIPVIPGERLSVSSALEIFPFSGPQASVWQLYVVFLNASGGFVSDVTIASGVGNSPFSLTTRLPDFVTVPVNGVRAVLNLRVQSAGAGTMRMGFLEPMIVSAAAGQTVHPPFTAGPNASDGADPNALIAIDSNGIINGIGTANINVDNRRAALQGLASARPGSGQFIGQEYHATDTREVSQWDGFNWRGSADITRAVSGPGDLVMQFRADLSLTSPLPLTADYQLGVAGASALTSGVSWSVSVASGTFAGTAPSIVGAGTGQLRINSELTSPEATLRITASFAGRASPPFVVTVRRQVALPSLAPLTTINSGTFAQAHDTPIQITLPSTASSVSLTAVADLLAGAFAPPGGIGVEGKWQRETSPGTWADVGSVQSASPPPEVFETEIAPGEFVYSATPGSITCNRTASGLTPGSIQRFRFVARVSSGSVRLITFVGNASATA